MHKGSLHQLLNSDNQVQLNITNDLIEQYSLEKWAAKFNLMTAGYRDQLDPLDLASPDVAFNAVTVAILGEAKARVFKQKAKSGETLHVHVGGETRPHTQAFIKVLARVYAAHQFTVHLRANPETTPIWYSSFGVFYRDYQSGDNLTASHSQFFKGGWKPIDSLGKQLVEEEDAIIREVQDIVRSNAAIQLASWDANPLILSDFDVTRAYVEYQKSVVPQTTIDQIIDVGKKGFRCSACTVGGSMKQTTEQIFRQMSISTGEDGLIQYYFDEEDSEYHKIGQIDGENYGVDPTKKQIYRNIGAQEKLLTNSADVVFIWDPDGDRFNMVTTANSDKADFYRDQGLEVETFPDSDRCIVYFTPNQIFLILTSSRIENLLQTGQLNQHDWFMASSVTTSRSLDELAKAHNIPIVHVKVGFKYWGNFAHWLENRTTAENHVPFEKMALNETVVIGENPRLILMCEESGGAVFGGTSLVKNFDGTKSLVGMREKDGFQFGFLSLALAAKLYEKKQSFADYYCELIDRYSIQNRFFHRHDERLYDERLTGKERDAAIASAEAKKQRIMDFFKHLAKEYENGVSAETIQDVLNRHIAVPDAKLPVPNRLCLIGESVLEGTYLEFETFWVVVRASGTDALLRYYIEGDDQETIKHYQQLIVGMNIS